MKLGKLAKISVGVFIAMAGIEYLVHGMVLKDLYEQTASIWRTQENMKQVCWMMWLGYLLFAPVFVYGYEMGHESKKEAVQQGACYGIFVGLLMTIMPNLVWFVVLPIPGVLALSWFVWGMAEFILVGALTGYLYEKI